MEVELRSMEGTLVLLDRWVGAYHHLQREYMRLHTQLIDAKFERDCARTRADAYELLYNDLLKQKEREPVPAL
jgi:hypothetical protein